MLRPEKDNKKTHLTECCKKEIEEKVSIFLSEINSF